MSDLEETHPDVHQKFLDGFHVIRRSNQCWARLSSDLVIEQTLMRSLKSIGGLTHGSGMFVHAYSGCDSASRIFGIGKKAVFFQAYSTSFSKIDFFNSHVPVGKLQPCALGVLMMACSSKDVMHLGSNASSDKDLDLICHMVVLHPECRCSSSFCTSLEGFFKPLL